MDSRDSSSAVPASAAAVGQSVNVDGLVSVACALAKEAALYFQEEKYVECLHLLQQLLLKKPGDPKVLHNIAVTEYFRDGCSDLRKFLNDLYNVKKRGEDRTRIAENSEDGNNTGIKSGSTTKWNTSIPENGDSSIYASEFDTAMASLNIATIWYHLHDYAKTLSILEPLFQNIEPLDETAAQHICLLLLDAGLASQNAAKSAEVLNYLEKAFNVSPSTSGNTPDAANTGHQQSPKLVPKSVSVPAASDVTISDATSKINIPENTLSRTMSEETIEYEILMSTLDVSGDYLRAGGLSASSNLSRYALDRSKLSPIIDLRLLQLYKVRFLLLTRNLKSIKREVKETVNLARGGDSTIALLLKSEFEYVRGNYKKAIKLLVASNCRNEAALSSLCNNNFGCIYYQAGQLHTAAIYFYRALSNCSALHNDKPKKLSGLSLDKSFAILYNCGLQYLACGKPCLAARCFQKAVTIFSKKPLLWLRIAECCLLALKKGLLESNGSSESSEVIVRVFGRGKWRKLVMEDGATKIGENPSLGNGKIVEDKPINLSVLLARHCLLNALRLLNSSSRATEFIMQSQMNPEDIKSKDTLAAGDGRLSNGDVKESKWGQVNSDMLKSSLVDFEQNRAREDQMIKQTVLGDLAYVELEIGNHCQALSAAKSLLELPDCTKIYLFLGHVYAAEALCLLGRPKEAADQLLKYMNEESGFVLPYGEEDRNPWKIKLDADPEDSKCNTQTTKSSIDSRKFALPSPDEARGILFVNFASVCAIQGDLQQAHKFARQAVSAIPNYTNAFLTLVYVNLMLGETQEAVARLKQCNRVKYISGS